MAIRQPEHKPGMVQSIIPMAASIVGGIFGGTGGAAAGSKIGGGMADNKVSGDSAIQRNLKAQQPPNTVASNQQPQGYGDDAMMRYLAKSNKNYGVG